MQVSDNGPGISAGNRDRIFDPFFTTKGKHATGLGLAVVFNGMQQHHGFAAVQSEKGMGCTFHLLFPMAIVTN